MPCIQIFLLTRKFFIDYRYFWLIELLYVFGAKYQETEITVDSQFRKFHEDGWVDETKSERREKRKKDCCHRGNSNDMFSKNSDRNRLIHLGMDDAYGKHGLCPAFRFSDLFLELMFIEKALQASTMLKQQVRCISRRRCIPFKPYLRHREVGRGWEERWEKTTPRMKL